MNRKVSSVMAPPCHAETGPTRPEFEYGARSCNGGGVLNAIGTKESDAHPHRERQHDRPRHHRPDPATPTEAADAGLRITTDDTPEPAFAISATEGPQPGDAKVEQDGATVYLDGPSAEQLDDKVLDASLDPAGNVQFALGQQA